MNNSLGRSEQTRRGVRSLVCYLDYDAFSHMEKMLPGFLARLSSELTVFSNRLHTRFSLIEGKVGNHEVEDAAETVKDIALAVAYELVENSDDESMQCPKFLAVLERLIVVASHVVVDKATGAETLTSTVTALHPKTYRRLIEGGSCASGVIVDSPVNTNIH